MKSFTRDMHKTLKDMQEKDIHNFRLDVKKIKALYCFLEVSFPGKIDAANYYKPFREIFKQSGKLREMQVAHNSLQAAHLSNEVLTLFKHILFKKSKKASRGLKHRIREMKAIVLNDKTIIKLCKALDEKTFDIKSGSFILYECREIESILQKPLEKENIHRLRKCVKEFDYGIRLINRIVPNKKYAELSKELKRTGDLIGGWHDTIVREKILRKILHTTKKLNDRELKNTKKCISTACAGNAVFLPGLRKNINLILALARQAE